MQCGDLNPLAIAAEGGHEAVVRALLDAGAHIDSIAYDSLCGEEKTPLYCVAQRGNVRMVRLLLALGADPAWQAHSGDHPFQAIDAIAAARKNGHHQVARILEQAVADKAKDEN